MKQRVYTKNKPASHCLGSLSYETLLSPLLGICLTFHASIDGVNAKDSTPIELESITVNRPPSLMRALGVQWLAHLLYPKQYAFDFSPDLIARALAQGARILILDEPMSGLDYGHQLRLLEHLQALVAEGYAVLKTTHHPEHALLASSRVALLHEGHIEADDLPSAVITAATIERLYNVQVQAQQWGPHTAFFPLSRTGV